MSASWNCSPARKAPFATRKSASEGTSPTWPMSAVAPTQSSVLPTRNGMRRGARSDIAPSTGESSTITVMLADTTPPYRPSACSAPTCSRTHSEKYSVTIPMEKIVFARS
jgi:hypothetical protein